jgi:outer membrane protein
MKTQLKLITFLATLVCGSAMAQTAGTWMVRAGATNITPNVSSGYLTAPDFLGGTKADVGSDSQLSGGITYMVTDNISVDVPLALPFKHKLIGDGALAGAG